MKQEDVEEFYKLRKEYKEKEKLFNSNLSESDIGSYEVNNLKYQIGINKIYTYSSKFIEKMKIKYEKEREKQKLEPKKGMYIKFL
jgi:hypothetical protein